MFSKLNLVHRCNQETNRSIFSVIFAYFVSVTVHKIDNYIIPRHLAIIKFLFQEVSLLTAIIESKRNSYGSQSKYKSLLVSEQTTVDELIQMLLSCYSSKEPVEQFSLYEVCESEEYQRKLHPDDSPLKVTQRWTSADRHLRIRRNPDYNPHRRKVLRVPTIFIATIARNVLNLF